MIDLHNGQLIASKFKLTRPHAKGGMGSVWLAEHVTLGIPVAVKFMDPRFDHIDDLRARFEREAKAAAQLRTPNVVQILDYGVERDTPYLVMEFLKGEDLGARLDRQGRLSLLEAIPILSQVCKALRRAHDEGIVHRDLKPPNVFLVHQDDEILVKVLDFGIAKVMQFDQVEGTKTGATMGSPLYMSPEQVRGLKGIDHRTDLWSLGVIVYRVLTGHFPFPGTVMGDIYLKICTERPIRPTAHAPDLGAQVDAFVDKALSVDPAKRFQSAKEMNDALWDLIGDAPMSIASGRPALYSTPFVPTLDAATRATPAPRSEPRTSAPVTQSVLHDDIPPRASRTSASHRRRTLAMIFASWLVVMAIGLTAIVLWRRTLTVAPHADASAAPLLSALASATVSVVSPLVAPVPVSPPPPSAIPSASTAPTVAPPPSIPSKKETAPKDETKSTTSLKKPPAPAPRKTSDDPWGI